MVRALRSLALITAIGAAVGTIAFIASADGQMMPGGGQMPGGGMGGPGMPGRSSGPTQQDSSC